MVTAAAWLDLLPYAEPEDVRLWLGERGAALLAERIPPAARRSCLSDPTHWPDVAAVLAALLGHPSDVIEGDCAM